MPTFRNKGAPQEEKEEGSEVVARLHRYNRKGAKNHRGRGL